ncbi:MAG: hypothetical protein KGD57_07535, partial [Candidatus Lokiarchaeota archaeon]|nr:hypothetical protein [Candidatus Lokiarchaeota archaeon]
NHYQKLIEIISKRKIKSGKWELCDIKSFMEDDKSSNNIISYHWWDYYNHFLIVLNYSDNPSKGYIKIPSLQFNHKVILFEDMFTRQESFLHGEELNNYGYYTELEGWQTFLFELRNL